jgi:hypothetical protein
MASKAACVKARRTRTNIAELLSGGIRSESSGADDRLSHPARPGSTAQCGSTGVAASSGWDQSLATSLRRWSRSVFRLISVEES